VLEDRTFFHRNLSFFNAASAFGLLIIFSFDANLLPKNNALETRYFDDCYETNQTRIYSVDLMAKI